MDKSVSAAEPMSLSLVTGQEVTVAKDDAGQASYLLQPAGRQDDGVLSWQLGSGADHYVVPVDALPFLGRGLDLSLFDVTALARNGLVGKARIPVTLAFAAGTAPTAPPGVMLTSVTGSTAQGYLTSNPGKAKAFVRELRREIGADVTAGRQPGSTPLFGGLTSMAVAGTRTVGGVTTRYPMHILPVTAMDESGAAADVMAIVVNNDSSSREAALMPVIGGLARIAVPAGDYSVAATFPTWDDTGNLTDLREVTALDATVPQAGNADTVSLDARTATSPVSLSTPKSSVREVGALDLGRFDASGQPGANLGLETWSSSARIAVAPASAPTVGRLQYRARFDMAATDPSDAYRYDAAFSADHIDANQAYAMDPSKMATVRHSISVDPASDPSASLLAGPFDSSFGPTEEVSGYTSLSRPEQYTEYVQTYPGSQWDESLFTFTGDLQGVARSFTGGKAYGIAWFHGPLAPTLGVHRQDPYDTSGCLMCTAGSVATLAYETLGDSTPDHFGMLYQNATADFYVNGQQVASGGGAGAVLTGVPAGGTTYRMVLTTDSGGDPGVSQSTHTVTDLIVKSPAAPDPASALPSWQTCEGGSADTPCQILPALNLTYNLAADLTNTTTSPLQAMAVTVGHISYDGQGSTAPITSLMVRVSFDGGTTWQPTSVDGADGHYLALWSNPASATGTSPMLQVTATDALGGSVQQTITNAYTIAAASAVRR